MSDDRYHFSNYDSTRNAKFVIKSVDYKDRAVYTCNASNGISFVTMEFTLRVRGRTHVFTETKSKNAKLSQMINNKFKLQKKQKNKAPKGSL